MRLGTGESQVKRCKVMPDSWEFGNIKSHVKQ